MRSSSSGVGVRYQEAGVYVEEYLPLYKAFRIEAEVKSQQLFPSPFCAGHARCRATGTWLARNDSNAQAVQSAKAATRNISENADLQYQE